MRLGFLSFVSLACVGVAAVDLVCTPPDFSDANPVRDCLNRPVISADSPVFIIEKIFEVPVQGNNQILPGPDGFIYVVTGLVTGTAEAHIYKCNPSNYDCTLWFDVDAATLAATGRNINFNRWQHGGLRSLAFHDDFSTTGRFYTSQMENRPKNNSGLNYLSDVEDAVAADSTVVEWVYDSSTQTIDPSSRRELFRIGMPVYDHPIKQIAFRNGWLYVTQGDGSVQSATTGGGQRKDDALGKLLRVKPTARGSSQPYTTWGNPFHGDPSWLPEIYAYGFRNPHHLAFTKAGNLIVAEAGRDNMEEINCIVAGRNYGWSEREGTFVHLERGRLFEGISMLPSDDAPFGLGNETLEYPCAQWGHNGPVGNQFTGEAGGGGFPIENGSPLDGIFPYYDFPKSGIIYVSKISDMLSATTNIDQTGNTSSLAPAQTSRAIIYDKTSGKIVDRFGRLLSISGRTDMRMGYGPNGEVYITTKRFESPVYVVRNSESSYIQDQYYTFPGSDCAGTLIGSESLGDLEGVSIQAGCEAKCSDTTGCAGFSSDGSVCKFRGSPECGTQRNSNGLTFRVKIPDYISMNGDCPQAQEITDTTTLRQGFGTFLSLLDCKALCAGDSRCVGFSFKATGTDRCILRSEACATGSTSSYTFYHQQILQPTSFPTTLQPTPFPTSSPITLHPVTSHPTTSPTANPSTSSPSTSSPTLNPTTSSPSTLSPITLSPATFSPTTLHPATAHPATAVPTSSPVSCAPTANPTTSSPNTLGPTTLSPITLCPTTTGPTTCGPTTLSPATTGPITCSPTTLSPTTRSPTTFSPTTSSPSTLGPTTVSPSVSPTTRSPSRSPSLSPTSSPTFDPEVITSTEFALGLPSIDLIDFPPGPKRNDLETSVESAMLSIDGIKLVEDVEMESGVTIQEVGVTVTGKFITYSKDLDSVLTQLQDPIVIANTFSPSNGFNTSLYGAPKSFAAARINSSSEPAPEQDAKLIFIIVAIVGAIVLAICGVTCYWCCRRSKGDKPRNIEPQEPVGVSIINVAEPSEKASAPSIADNSKFISNSASVNSGVNGKFTGLSTGSKMNPEINIVSEE